MSEIQKAEQKSGSQRDVEKGEEYETNEPELVENLLSPAEVEHRELAAASTHLHLPVKIGISLLVVAFILVEAYFVGQSLARDADEQRRSPPNILPKIKPAREFVVMPVEKLFTPDSFKDVVTPEPFEDFEGGLNLHATAVRDHDPVMKVPITPEVIRAKLRTPGTSLGPEETYNFPLLGL